MIILDLTEPDAWDAISKQHDEEFKYFYVSKDTARAFMLARFDAESFHENPMVTFRYKGEEIARAKVLEFLEPGHPDNSSKKSFLLLLDGESWRRIHPDNTSWTTRRQTVPDSGGRLEKGLAEYWVEKNDETKNGALNLKCGLIQDLLLSERKYGNHPADFETWVSPRERKIVATFVQWLGTNGGYVFLTEAFKRGGYDVTIKRTPDAEFQAKLNEATK